MSDPTKKPQQPQAYPIARTIKADTYMVMQASAAETEDEFDNAYFSSHHDDNGKTNLALLPPFPPKTLKSFVFHNNILNQCVQAMEVNVDGTGHEFVALEESDEPDAAELKIAESFFNEPYPGKSTVAIRRRLRRDIESVGYGFLEPLRTIDGRLAGFRNVETTDIRLIKLDKEIPVVKSIMRNGEEIKMTVFERERRFWQKVGGMDVYYREFGSTRQINRKSGEWLEDGTKVPKDQIGGELLYFTLDPDYKSPYGLPRWINQLPSVIGSRKAEEQNLEFFDAGGMPPAIIFIQGGTLAGDVSSQLRAYLSGQNKVKNRAVVVEAQSSSGSLESSGSVQVRVERFGAEKAGDGMYSKYDAAAEEHVRVSFRLPPLFLGKAADYSFASAVVSYMVAEAQVFGPERSEFDEIMNKTFMRELGLKNIKFKSKPVTLKSIDSQLKAIGLVKDSVTVDSFVGEINSLTGLALEAKSPEEIAKEAANAAAMMAAAVAPTQADEDKDDDKEPDNEPAKVDAKPDDEDAVDDKDTVTNPDDNSTPDAPKTKFDLVEFATELANIDGLIATRDLSSADCSRIRKMEKSLDLETRSQVHKAMVAVVFGSVPAALIPHDHEH